MEPAFEFVESDQEAVAAAIRSSAFGLPRNDTDPAFGNSQSHLSSPTAS